MGAAFAAGFAAGLLCLALALWASGSLQSARVPEAGPCGQAASNQAKPAVSPAAGAAANTQPQPGRDQQQPGADHATVRPHGEARLPAMPVPGVRASDLLDTFNESRGGHKHEALDIAAPRGTPVIAAVEGNIAKLFNSKRGGLTIYQFDDAQVYCYYYAHLDRYAPGLKEGMLVRQGEVMAYVGSTGDASPDAPHLHFAIFELGPRKRWWEGTPVDPLPLLQAAGRQHP